MIMTVILQIDRMNYYGICHVEEHERVDLEQVLLDSIRSGIDTNVIQFNNVKCVRMDREPADGE